MKDLLKRIKQYTEKTTGRRFAKVTTRTYKPGTPLRDMMADTKQPKSFSERMESLNDGAVSLLKSRGLPWKFPIYDAFDPEDICIAENKIEDFEPDSPEGLAWKIVFHYRMMNHETDTNQKQEHAFELGRLYQLAKVLDIESRGARKAHETKHGNDKEKRARWAKYQPALEKYRDQHPHHSFTQARIAVAKELGVGLTTFKQHTHDHKK